jgi:mannose-6-phosphate isomerase-like protein (cupin superfamily)
MAALYSAAMRIPILLALASTAALAAADTPPAAICKTAAELTDALKAGQATPDMLTSEVQNTDRHRINIVRRTRAAGAVAHEGFAELHQIIEGAGTLVTGGTLVRAEASATGSRQAGGPSTIQNGVSRHVAKGDVILIPPGMPHWYKDLEGTITYLEVRWSEK